MTHLQLIVLTIGYLTCAYAAMKLGLWIGRHV